MSSTSNNRSDGFGITLHHEGQTADNSLAPSPSGGTGDSNKQTTDRTSAHQTTKESNKQGPISEHDIKNNRP